VFDAVRKSGLDPAEFVWEEQDSAVEGRGRISVLRHRPSREFYFCFDGMKFFHSPGRESRAEAHTTSWLGAINSVVPKWLQYLRREIEADRPWEELAARLATTDFLKPVPSGANTPFTPEETGVLRDELDTLKGEVRAGHQFNKEQAAKVDACFEEMRARLDRLGRFDWRDAAVGAIVSLAVDLGAPAVAHVAFKLVGRLLTAPAPPALPLAGSDLV